MESECLRHLVAAKAELCAYVDEAVAAMLVEHRSTLTEWEDHDLKGLRLKFWAACDNLHPPDKD